MRIDAGTGRVTNVLVRHGPAWDRAIPDEAVAGFGEDGIRLAITRQQVRDLPPATSTRSDAPPRASADAGQPARVRAGT